MGTIPSPSVSYACSVRPPATVRSNSLIDTSNTDIGVHELETILLDKPGTPHLEPRRQKGERIWHPFSYRDAPPGPYARFGADSSGLPGAGSCGHAQARDRGEHRPPAGRPRRLPTVRRKR